jgi:hypothetical protein
LKAAGLPLATIVHILDDDVPVMEALEAHRSRLLGAIAEHRTHLAVVDAMLNATDHSLAPELVEVEAVHAIVAEAECAPDELTGTIRRLVQRLRRERVRGLGVTPSTYSARFPLDPTAGPSAGMATRVAAHLDSPCRGSVVIDAVRAVAVDVVGSHALLPLAQDAAIAEARTRGLVPCGWVWEHYFDLGVNHGVNRGVDRGRLPHSRLLLPVASQP